MTNVLSNNVTKTANPSGVFEIPPLTVRDATTFNALLMICRSLDIQRRVKLGEDVRKSAAVDAIRGFCEQALMDIKPMVGEVKS